MRYVTIHEVILEVILLYFMCIHSAVIKNLTKLVNGTDMTGRVSTKNMYSSPVSLG